MDATDTAMRPAAPADAPAVHRLLNAIDTIEIGHPETDLHTVEADLARTDVWLVEEEDGPVALGMVWRDSGEPVDAVAHGTERIDADLYALPGRSAATAALLTTMEGRAAELAAATGASRAVVHLGLSSATSVDTGLVRSRGWRPVRRYNVLTREVDATLTAPGLPDGVTFRACRTEDERRLVHALMEEAFADHYDHRARSYEEWRGRLEESTPIDWSLVWIAHVDGLGDAAAILARDDRANMGWVRALGVRRAARGRGLGGLLLRQAFAEFARRGRTTVGLAVDTGNTTGALRLYERSGMSVYFAADTWELTVPLVPRAR
ncbi:GNAT family N-acetyltransferase [Streptomyces sp. NPDC057445]|uniref:GNAT family N-acetyltransferase n=1 Tax=Streptomyces sp. NPDC057445 TaxID=3346136 RepID=UPI0036B37FEA